MSAVLDPARPVGHSKQLLLSAAYMPGAQGVQVAEPIALEVTPRSGSQLAQVMLPMLLLKDPTAQSVQLAAAFPTEYFPGEHKAQNTMPEYFPGVHAKQAVAALVAANMPALQKLQPEAPIALWYVPAGQGVQLAEATLAAYSPAVQVAHDPAAAAPAYCPTLQLVQRAEAAAEYFPAVQSPEHADDVIPVVEPNRPEEQLVHDTAPLAMEYVATSHGMQVLAP